MASGPVLNWDRESKLTNIFAGANDAYFMFNCTNVSSTDVTMLSAHPSGLDQ